MERAQEWELSTQALEQVNGAMSRLGEGRRVGVRRKREQVMAMARVVRDGMQVRGGKNRRWRDEKCSSGELDKRGRRGGARRSNLNRLLISGAHL